MNRELFVRSKANPIIKPTDVPFSVNGVLNPGVALVDGEVVLLLRIENRRGSLGYMWRGVRMVSMVGISSKKRSWHRGWPTIHMRSGVAKTPV